MTGAFGTSNWRSRILDIFKLFFNHFSFFSLQLSLINFSLLLVLIINFAFNYIVLHIQIRVKRRDTSSAILCVVVGGTKILSKLRPRGIPRKTNDDRGPSSAPSLNLQSLLQLAILFRFAITRDLIYYF